MRYIYPLLIAIIFNIISANAVERTVSTVSQLNSAIASSIAGDVILINGGTYLFTSRLNINNKNGTASNRIIIKANPESATRPLFDFSAMAEGGSNQGIRIENSSYLHIIGIDVYKAGDNGMLLKNSHNNIVEFCTFSECADSGLQLDDRSSNNLILNCDSYYNADSNIENADGFACKLDVGTGNIFKGCRAWQNLDDGWDGYLRGNDNVTTIYENCWAFDNGKLKNGTISGGDGNGFKTGGSDNKDLKHNAILTNCIAAGNVNKGFDHNNNRGEVTIYNSASSGNAINIRFGNSNRLSKLTIKNTLVFGPIENLYADVLNVTHNSWNSSPAITVNAASFESVDVSELKKPRKSDGSLPDINYLRPVSGSSLINRGVDVGLPYIGSAPDIGVFEYDPSLPLDLLRFEVDIEPITRYITLDWQTTNEVNTKEFVIEKRTDDTGFIEIGTQASNNTSGIHNYSFTDYNVTSGNVYYRLKQVDKDGKYKYSDIVQLSVNAGVSLEVYPNPTDGILNIVHAQAVNAAIRILSIDGKVLNRQAVKAGTNITSLDVSKLKAGTYLVNYNNAGKVLTVKFAKR